MGVSKALTSISLLALLAACSTTTNFQATDPNAALTVKTTSITKVPRTEVMSATSFGNYEFMLQPKEGEPMYGLLPLKFNGGYLAVDILLFAPAMFFNLREPYPFYEFDAAKNTVRYRKQEDAPWQDYMPSAEEAARARVYFGK